MSSSPAIIVENLSKQYVLGGEVDQTQTFRDMLTGIFKQPVQRLKRLQGSSKSQEKFWALKDINFEINEGEVVGIIGANGAGKSTLLKVLSRITAPTKGAVHYKGRIASLLEVGTGFHPELSGRENIYVNGAILGMTKADIRKRFDEIVEFAGVEQFLDTPVKRYSSGMYVRLAFAVAAHMDPDILIIDEVLAVGDATFQKKCLGMMHDISQAGRTVLFVSHNLSAVRKLCPLLLLIEDGSLKFHGETDKGLAIYENNIDSAGTRFTSAQFEGELSDQIKFDELVSFQGGEKVSILDPMQDFELKLSGAALRRIPALDLNIAIFRDGQLLTSCFDAPQNALMMEGKFVSRFHMPANILKPGRYTIGVGAVASKGGWVWGSDVMALNFTESSSEAPEWRNRGAVTLPYTAERIQ